MCDLRACRGYIGINVPVATTARGRTILSGRAWRLTE